VLSYRNGHLVTSKHGTFGVAAGGGGGSREEAKQFLRMAAGVQFHFCAPVTPLAEIASRLLTNGWLLAHLTVSVAVDRLVRLLFRTLYVYLAAPSCGIVIMEDNNIIRQGNEKLE